MGKRNRWVVAALEVLLLVGNAGAVGGGDRKNLRFSFKIRSRALESVGNFIVEQGKQVNYVIGGNEPAEIATNKGKGVEFKRYGTIVNAIVSVSPADGKAEVQLQIERSGPLGAMRSLLNAKPDQTFQIQTTFSAELGKSVVIVDEPDRRVEVLVEEASL